MKITKMVDDLIQAAIEYADSLSVEVPLTVFDLKAERLWTERQRLICFLRGNDEKK